MENEYTEEELELTEELLEYWIQGRVSTDSVWLEEDGTVGIIWHYA